MIHYSKLEPVRSILTQREKREATEEAKKTNSKVTHMANALAFVKIVLFNINY